MRGKRKRKDRRREPRFEANIWVGIPEAEGEADVESCNISASGMLLRTNRNAGEPGAVRMLRLVTGDLAASVEVMAHVVRVETRPDPFGGQVHEATAFEFLPHRPEELDEFLGIALDGEFTVPVADRRASPPACDPPEEVPTEPVVQLQVSHLAFVANRNLEAGTRIRIELGTPAGESFRLTGSCLESLALEGAGDEDLYHVQVGLDSGDASCVDTDSEGDSNSNTNSNSNSDTNSDTAGAMTGRQRQGVHLSGTLSEVAITGLLGFLELERSSGVLFIEHESEKASIFVSEGSVVDVDIESERESAMDSLTRLLNWPDGTFEFSFQTVDRADAIGMSTTALLMESARKQDEDSRLR
jgi:hypothetical protein